MANKPVAIIVGKFKIPTRGHWSTIHAALAESKRVIVIISPKEVDGFTAEDSEWVFKQFFKSDSRVKYRISEPIPFRTLYDVIEGLEGDVCTIWGTPEDSSRYNDVLRKFPNVSLRTIARPEGITATATRQAIKSGDYKTFSAAMPDLFVAKEVWNHFRSGRPETSFASFRSKTI